MKQKALVEIDGKKYMSPKAAGDLWSMSHQAVTAACNEGRVEGVARDSGNHFIIPIDAKKPIEKETIRKILISLLAMKNRPGSELLNHSGADELFSYLESIGLIEGNDLWTAALTNKGMEWATSGARIQIDWVNAGITLLSVLRSLASIWSAMP